MRLNDLKKGDTISGICTHQMGVVPEWMDFDKFRRGREFFFKHAAAIVIAMWCSLAVGLSVSNLLLPLVFTGNSNTPKKSFFRYFHTFLHVALWHYDDVWEEDSKAHKSIRKVCDWHSRISTKMNKSHEGHVSSEKLYFSQYDMALVQSGFFGAVIMYPKKFGISCSADELDDYVFFWRGIGYLIGVSDKYNLCSETYETTYEICKQIEKEVILPSLSHPSVEFEMMVDAYIQGIKNAGYHCGMTKEALFAFVFHCMDLPIPTVSLMDKVRFFCLRCFVFLIYWCPCFELMVNNIIKTVYQSEVHLLHL